MIRDQYIHLLTKYAGLAPGQIDNAAVACAEHDANRQDQGKILKDLFSRGDESMAKQGPELGKMFDHSGSADVSNPLLKLANDMFLHAVKSTDLLKTAEPHFLQATFHSFLRELEKIAEQTFDFNPGTGPALELAPVSPSKVVRRGAIIGDYSHRAARATPTAIPSTAVRTAAGTMHSPAAADIAQHARNLMPAAEHAAAGPLTRAAKAIGGIFSHR